jgi:hypothetical protein
MGGKSSKSAYVNESFGFNENTRKKMGEFNKLKNAAKKYIKRVQSNTKQFKDPTLATERLKNTNNFKTYKEYSEKIPGAQMENKYPYGPKTTIKNFWNHYTESWEKNEVYTNKFETWRQLQHKNPNYKSREDLLRNLNKKYKNISGLDRNILFYIYKNPNSNASSFLRR